MIKTEYHHQNPQNHAHYGYFAELLTVEEQVR
jgi:hypothetical protein